MRGLKILVVVMGVLIIIAFGTIIVTLVHRMVSPSSAPRDVSVSLPSGSHIDAIYGSGDRLILDLGADGTDPRISRRLMVIDPATGAVSRTITVRPSPP